MIKLFDEALRIIFFPVRWANAVTTWIQNVASPDDSLKVGNTCSPKEGSSLRLTVNMQRIYDGVKTYFADFWITPDKLGEALDESCDKETIIREGGRYRLADEVIDEIGEGRKEPYPFEVRIVTKPSGSSKVLDYWKIYLPNGLNIRFGRTVYAVVAGNGTGEVVDLGGGWYKINGLAATGTIFAVDASTEQEAGWAKNWKVKFSNTPVSGDHKLNYDLGWVSYDSSTEALSIWQQPTVLQGSNIGTGFIELDSTNPIEISGASSTDSSANFTGAGQILLQNTWVRGSTVLAENTGTTNNPVWVTKYDADGNPQLCGVKLRQVSRVVRIIDKDYYVFRDWIFDKNGMLREVSEEKAVFGEYNDVY